MVTESRFHEWYAHGSGDAQGVVSQYRTLKFALVGSKYVQHFSDVCYLKYTVFPFRIVVSGIENQFGYLYPVAVDF